MTRRRYLFVISFVACLGCSLSRGADCWSDEIPAFQEAARELQASIVTVRVSLFPGSSDRSEVSENAAHNRDSGAVDNGSASVRGDRDHAVPETPGDSGEPEPERDRGRVTVCSGVSLGGGLVVAPVFAASDSVIRITLPGGGQASARLRVIDEYSGLSLLVADRREMPGIELSDELPEVGSWILSAAAWGVEKPVVSVGIVSGHDRSLAGLSYPPLLQCSLPTAETSAGAGVVDQGGRLLGVIVAAESEPAKRGWSYAVPVRHVKRLLRAHQESTETGVVVVIKRRRPVVGMILSGNPDEILVKRVESGSPAEKAGIRAGDRILESDGIKIRSVYQAIRPILNRQPGDSVVFRVRQGSDVRDIEVVLGGGILLPSAPFERLGQVIRPKLDIDGGKGGRVGIRNATGTVKEVFAPPPPDDDPTDARSGGSERSRAAADAKIELLEKALDGYQNVILFQQARLKEGEDRRIEAEKTIERLRKEIEELKEQSRQPRSPD